MNTRKEIWMSGFALFSMFFGAGNLILPPLLGFKALDHWYIVAMGFIITAVIIPIMAIYAHANLQGTLYDFGKKVSSKFSIVYCVLIYLIAIALPAPRTASVTHEMAIAPFFETPALLTSSIYFGFVLLFALNRSKILSVLGKLLTPLIGIILLSIIVVGITIDGPNIGSGLSPSPLVDGILEGYQTFDAIGGVVVGAVLIISLNLRGHTSFEAKKELIIKSGWIAGAGLIIIYTGLIALGALLSPEFNPDSTRTELLSGLSLTTLGAFGAKFLSILVALACFTTAVGVITGTADYFKGLYNHSQWVYTTTAIVSCLVGVIVGSYDVSFIIDIALPILFLIYPITIVLIILNILPSAWASRQVFRVVVGVTFLFSIPDVMTYIVGSEAMKHVLDLLPLAEYSLAWVIPSCIALVAVNFYQTVTTSSNS